jgi:hypothetical protein
LKHGCARSVSSDSREYHPRWWRDLASGPETQVTCHGGFFGIESYDGKTLFYSKIEGGGLWSIPVAGGTEELVTPALHRRYWGHFAVTGDGIYLLDVDATPRPTIVYYSFQTRRLLACPALSRILRMWEASTPTAIRTCLPWWSLVEAPGSSPGTKAGPTDRTLLP